MRQKIVKSTVLLVPVFLLSGCMMLLEPPPKLPQLTAFEEGDVVVTLSGGIVSWFVTLSFMPERAASMMSFSHAEMVYRDAEGTLMLGGVFQDGVGRALLVDRMGKFHRIAVFRAKAPLKKRKKAAHILREWLEDPKIQDADFNYFFDYKPGKKAALFCAGIVNEAYRVAGLALPFSYLQWTPSTLTSHIEKIVGRKLSGLLDLFSIKESDHFTQVLVWENNQENNMDRVRRSKRIVLYLIQQYENGWRLRSSQGFNPFLKVVSLPDGIERLFKYKTSLKRFAQDIAATWHRLERRGELEGLDGAEKDALLGTICDKYREKYFYRPDTVRIADQQLHPATLRATQ